MFFMHIDFFFLRNQDVRAVVSCCKNSFLIGCEHFLVFCRRRSLCSELRTTKKGRTVSNKIGGVEYNTEFILDLGQ